MNDTQKQVHALEQVLAYHEALRRLKFTPDELFLYFDSTEPRIGIAIRLGGDDGDPKGILLGERTLPVDEVKRLWLGLADRWNRETRDETPWVQDVWNNRGLDATRLLVVLQGAGLLGIYRERVEAEEAAARARMRSKSFKN